MEQKAGVDCCIKGIPQIKWQVDKREIKKAIHSNKLPVKFQSDVLNIDNFEAAIKKKTWVLDINAHGEQDIINTTKVSRHDMGIPEDAK